MFEEITQFRGSPSLKLFKQSIALDYLQITRRANSNIFPRLPKLSTLDGCLNMRLGVWFADRLVTTKNKAAMKLPAARSDGCLATQCNVNAAEGICSARRAKGSQINN